jgi:hypothetical protein
VVTRLKPGTTLLLCLASACRPATPSGDQGHAEVQWNGSARGKLSGAATAAWCADRRRLEVQALKGDTGVGLAIYPRDSLVPGRYPVVDPARAESLPPAAGVALRWLGQSAVFGAQGDSGTINLTKSASGRFSAQLTARARSLSDGKRVTVTGAFRDLVVRPGSRGCAPPDEAQNEDAEPGDTGVH